MKLIEIERFIVEAADFIWGTPLLIWLMGGGIFFAFYSRFLPLFYFGHAIDVLRGKYDESEGQGEIRGLINIVGSSLILSSKIESWI